MQKIIKCTVSGEYVRGSGVVAGAAGSHDDVVLELAFKDIWEETTKTAFWWDANGENPTATILTLAMLVPGEREVYRVPIPAEAKAYEGQMKLTLRGAILSESGIVEEQATVSADAYFDILPGSVPEEYKELVKIEPTVAEKLAADLQIVDKKADTAINSANNATNKADEALGIAQQNAEDIEEIKKSGGVDEETLQQIVEEYLNENPPEVDLSGYATTQYVDSAINAALVSIPTAEGGSY